MGNLPDKPISHFDFGGNFTENRRILREIAPFQGFNTA
jgi:hypothetical protein